MAIDNLTQFATELTKYDTDIKEAIIRIDNITTWQKICDFIRDIFAVIFPCCISSSLRNVAHIWY